MNPAVPTADVDFGPTVELILLVLGVVMTVGVGCVGVWLVRTMRREDRDAKRAQRRGDET